MGAWRGGARRRDGCRGAGGDAVLRRAAGGGTAAGGAVSAGDGGAVRGGGAVAWAAAGWAAGGEPPGDGGSVRGAGGAGDAGGVPARLVGAVSADVWVAGVLAGARDQPERDRAGAGRAGAAAGGGQWPLRQGRGGRGDRGGAAGGGRPQAAPRHRGAARRRGRVPGWRGAGGVVAGDAPAARLWGRHRRLRPRRRRRTAECGRAHHTGARAGLLMGAAVAAARLGFESLVQREVPSAARGTAITRAETTFQLAWVLGALPPVALPLPTTPALIGVGVVCVLAGLAYAAGLFRFREGAARAASPGSLS